MIISATFLLLTGQTIFAENQLAPTHSAPNVIGFFQSYDDPNVWYFNGNAEDLKNSGYTVLIDAFWVNYPYCWDNGSIHSPIPECAGIKNKPGPGTSNGIDQIFWQNYQGGQAPSAQGESYNRYWTSLHTTGPQTISNIRNKINASGQKIKLLASIGGWNMGGSSAGNPVDQTLDKNGNPAWAALLKNPNDFAQDMSDIVNLQNNGTQLYDGIDLDIETLYGEGCHNNQCSSVDKDKAINDIVTAVQIFKYKNSKALLSISPRATDLYCDHTSCPWNNLDGVGFIGEILQKLAKNGIYFDYINPQFYNDVSARNIPNDSNLNYGEQIPSIFQHIKDLNIIGPNTSFNIGMLAQTNAHEVDTGGASSAGNPGIAKTQVKTLWDKLQTDPQISQTGIKINGIMGWSANLDLNDTKSVGGNVRTTSSSNAHVVPYNWGADIT